MHFQMVIGKITKLTREKQYALLTFTSVSGGNLPQGVFCRNTPSYQRNVTVVFCYFVTE